MAYEMLVGLKIKDPDLYQSYREAMGPILKAYGGGFRYDFWIRETLKSESSDPIDRVFAIYFQDKPGMEEFFANPDYLMAKKKFFEESVESTTIIASYET
jgi:uncharacterized protein (DUF1330 family)